jgi:hypothetical protein
MINTVLLDKGNIYWWRVNHLGQLHVQCGVAKLRLDST